MFAVLSKFTGKLEIKTGKRESVISFLPDFCFTYLCLLPPGRFEIASWHNPYLVTALFNIFLPYFLPVLVQQLSRNQANLWVAICHLKNVVVNFFSIRPRDEYFHFPKAKILHCTMKYTVQGFFSPSSPSLYPHSFLNFNRFPEITANFPFWDTAKSSRQFETASVCAKQAL